MAQAVVKGRSDIMDIPMDQQTRRCLEEVVEYMFDDEYKHWQEDGRPEAHIYNCVETLERWLELAS